MDVVDRIVLRFEELGYPVGCGCGVVASDGHQELDVVVLEQGEVEVLLEILVGGLETAHLEIGTATVEIGVCLEEIDVFGAGSLGEKAAVTAMQADNTVTVGQESLGNRHNDGVHTRSRAATTKDDNGIFHMKLIICK